MELRVIVDRLPAWDARSQLVIKSIMRGLGLGGGYVLDRRNYTLQLLQLAHQQLDGICQRSGFFSGDTASELDHIFAIGFPLCVGDVLVAFGERLLDRCSLHLRKELFKVGDTRLRFV